MKKEIIRILIVMLLITTAFVPISNAIHLNTKIEKEDTEITAIDGPKMEISLPDVHVYFPESRFEWATVEFDEPGAVIDIDLSEIEEDEVKIIFTQKIICHVQKQLLPATVISSISRPQKSASSSFEYVGSVNDWITIARHGYFTVDKVEDETYPLVVAVTGVPMFLRWAVFVYYMIMMNFFLDLMFDIPSELEKIYGEVTEYQLHVHT
jgi:hypothetical protein